MAARHNLIGVLMVLAILACAFVGIAIAGQVGDYEFVTVTRGTGAATWTNTKDYSAIEVKRISASGNYNATNQVTAKRVILDSSDNAYTQTMGVVTCSGGAGTQATLAYTILKQGDTIQFSSLIATGCVAIVEYEVQQH